MRTRVCVQIWYVSLRLIIRTPGKSLSALLMHAQMCQKIKSSYGNDKLWNFLLIPSVLSDFHLALIFNHSRNKQHIIVWHFCNRKGALYLLHSSYRNSTWHNSFFWNGNFYLLFFVACSSQLYFHCHMYLSSSYCRGQEESLNMLSAWRNINNIYRDKWYNYKMR